MKETRQNYVTTMNFAESVGVKPTTVHRNLCVNGHYMGVKPIKLPDGRLLWPEDVIDQIIESREKQDLYNDFNEQHPDLLKRDPVVLYISKKFIKLHLNKY